jgi:hypothetical protein
VKWEEGSECQEPLEFRFWVLLRAAVVYSNGFKEKSRLVKDTACSSAVFCLMSPTLSSPASLSHFM